MKLISIAAGRGTRLHPLTENTPKILLEIGDGVTLMEHQYKLISTANLFDESIYVTGFCVDKVEEAIRELSSKYSLPSGTLFNPFFATTNNFVSVWLAREHFSTETMLSNGDNLFQPSIYHDLYNAKGEGFFLAVSRKDEFDDDDMKARVSPDGKLLAVAKTLDPKDCQAESLGLFLVRGDKARDAFCQCVEDLARDEANLDRYWLTILNELISRGVEINTVNVNGEEDWQEVDFEEDLARAAERFRFAAGEGDS